MSVFKYHKKVSKTADYKVVKVALDQPSVGKSKNYNMCALLAS